MPPDSSCELPLEGIAKQTGRRTMRGPVRREPNGTISVSKAAEVHGKWENCERCLEGDLHGKRTEPVIRPWKRRIEEGQVQQHSKRLKTDETPSTSTNNTSQQLAPDMPAYNYLEATGATIGPFAGASAVTFLFGAFHKLFIEKKELTANDAKELGLEAGKNGMIGGLTGFGVYHLTHTTSMGGPVAGLIVGTSLRLGTLANSCISGNLTTDQLLYESGVAVVEAGLMGVTTIIGQALVPVPLFGAMLGSFMAQLLIQAFHDHQKFDLLKAELEERRGKFVSELKAREEENSEVVEKWESEVLAFTDKCFATSNTGEEALAGSLELARYLKVPSDRLVKDERDLKGFVERLSTW